MTTIADGVAIIIVKVSQKNAHAFLSNAFVFVLFYFFFFLFFVSDNTQNLYNFNKKQNINKRKETKEKINNNKKYFQ